MRIEYPAQQHESIESAIFRLLLRALVMIILTGCAYLVHVFIPDWTTVCVILGIASFIGVWR